MGLEDATEENVPLAPVERAPEEEFVFTAEEEEVFKQWRGKKDPSEELIWRAAKEDKPAFIKYLALQGYGTESLLKAAHKGKEQIVKSLVTAGVDVNTRDDKRNTPLIRAVEKGHAETVLALIELNADLDAQDSEGYTALMWAATGGKRWLVTDLIEAGANLDIQNKYGNTALISIAISGFRTGIVEDLILAGADPYIRGNENRAAMLWARHNGREETLSAFKRALETKKERIEKAAEEATEVESRARENPKSTNGLLELEDKTHETEWLDTRTPETAGGNDKEMETVEVQHGTED